MINRRRRFSIGLLLLVPLSVSMAIAQGTKNQNKNPETEHAEIYASFSLQGPPGPASPSAPQILLQAGQTDSKGEIIFKMKKKSSFLLKISASTKEGADATEFASLDGLADKSTLAATWTRVIWGSRNYTTKDTDDLKNRLEVVRKKYDIDNDNQIVDGYQAGEAVREKTKSDALARRAEIDWDRAHYNSSGIWAIGFEGKAGYKQYKYYDSNSKNTKENLVSESASAILAWIYGPGRWSLGVTYQHNLKESELQGERCEPIQNHPELEQCKQLPVGSPAYVDSFLFRLELRHIFNRWGIAPVASWEKKKDVFGLELPIYLVPDDKDNLTGGVKVGWRSDKECCSLSVFVTKPLSLF